MELSKRGIIELAGHEAIVLNPYRDSVGVWTVGIGHTAAAGVPRPREKFYYSLAEVFEIFARDIKSCERRVRCAFKNCKLRQHEFDAAVSFDFNTGAINRATWVKHFCSGNIVDAKVSFMRWKKPAAILERRRREYELFFSGVYSGNGYVRIYSAKKNGRVMWRSGKSVRVPHQLFVVLGEKEKKSFTEKLKSFVGKGS